MAQKILLVLTVLFFGRVLQDPTADLIFFKAGKKRIFTKALIEKNCFLKKQNKSHDVLIVYKSFYCFKKQNKNVGIHLILSTSSKRKPPRLKPAVQIFIPMKKWDKIVFL